MIFFCLIDCLIVVGCIGGIKVSSPHYDNADGDNIHRSSYKADDEGGCC